MVDGLVAHDAAPVHDRVYCVVAEALGATCQNAASWARWPFEGGRLGHHVGALDAEDSRQQIPSADQDDLARARAHHGHCGLCDDIAKLRSEGERRNCSAQRAGSGSVAAWSVVGPVAVSRLAAAWVNV